MTQLEAFKPTFIPKGTKRKSKAKKKPILTPEEKEILRLIKIIGEDAADEIVNRDIQQINTFIGNEKSYLLEEELKHKAKNGAEIDRLKERISELEADIKETRKTVGALIDYATIVKKKRSEEGRIK